MGLIESFKNFVGTGGYEDEDDNYDDYDENEAAPRPSINNSKNDQLSREERQFKMQVTTQLQVILVKPEVFSDTKIIADNLCNKKTVVLNLESTTPDVSRRIIDFIGGVAYAKGGNLKPIANNTFIIFPYDVNFEGEDIAAELENNGVVF